MKDYAQVFYANLFVYIYRLIVYDIYIEKFAIICISYLFVWDMLEKEYFFTCGRGTETYVTQELNEKFSRSKVNEPIASIALFWRARIELYA